MSGASMPSARRSLGQFGEAAAAAHLHRAGYRLLARNWRHQLGEIDLVARSGDQLVFVEVRTRRAGPVTPQESVGLQKARRLVSLAQAFLATTDAPPETEWRIDLIAVVVGSDGRVASLEQIQGAIEG